MPLDSCAHRGNLLRKRINPHEDHHVVPACFARSYKAAQPNWALRDRIDTPQASKRAPDAGTIRRAAQFEAERYRKHIGSYAAPQLWAVREQTAELAKRRGVIDERITTH